MEEQLQEQFHKAFYDLIRIAVEKNDHKYIVRLYTEIRDRLTNMLINKTGPTYQQIIADFDVPFFEQRLQHQVFDMNSMVSLVEMTFTYLHDLQMPIRDSVTAAAKSRVLESKAIEEIVPMYIKEVHLILDTMEQDMKEFYENREHPVVVEMLRKAVALQQGRKT